MKKFGKKLLATVVAATLVLGLTACGAAKDSGDAGTSDDSSSSSSSSGDTIKVGTA